MRFSLSLVAMLLAFFVMAGVLHARMLRNGVINTVFAEQRMVFIDHQKYKVAKGAEIYHASAPEQLLQIIDLQVGQRVAFDAFFKDGQPSDLKFIIIKDNR